MVGKVWTTWAVALLLVTVLGSGWAAHPAPAAAAVRGTVATGTVATGTAVGSPQPTRVFVHCNHRRALVRPARILLACGDGNAWYRHLRWSRWGRESARGTGRLWVNDCRPYCAAGTFHAYPLRLRLDRPRVTAGVRVFHRSTYVFTAKKPGWLPRRGHLLLPN